MTDAELETRETFLRAIFDSPDDPTPRLIFADWLEERGDNDFALLLRNNRIPNPAPKPRPPRPSLHITYSRVYLQNFQDIRDRGFPGYSLPLFELTTSELGHRYATVAEQLSNRPHTTTHNVIDFAEVRRLRVESVTTNPVRFISKTLHLQHGTIVDDSVFNQWLTYLALHRIRSLDLGATIIPVELQSLIEMRENSDEYTVRPVITNAGVAALARHRICQSLTELNLCDNDLGNDAALAIVRSPYFDQLETLQLMTGNRIRGRVWQEVVERFGEDVVS